MDGATLNKEISALVESWCDRRELVALAGLLPAWTGNNGLTDGWWGLATALRSVAGYHQLPESERAILKRLWVELDYYLRSRELPSS